jgi:uncharacterized protein
VSIENSLATRKNKNYTVVMTIRFEWDPKKAASNEKKHGVSFEEARTVFFDENAKLIDDPDHSEDEERFVLLGLSSSLRVILVCHCYRDEGGVIRIISARKASSHESKQYR